MFTVHEPVLVGEVLDSLDPQKNQNFIDCTVGGGGHAKKILDLTGPDGKMLGLDWDAEAIKRVGEILPEYSKRLTLVHSNYIDVKKVAYERKFDRVSGILIDLGLSMDQLQVSKRGFTFQTNEPLDMRYSQDTEITAADILNTYSEEELSKTFWRYAEEKSSRKIAKAIVEAREEKPFKTTGDLVSLIIKTKTPDRRRKIHPATQVFQALRIAVNNELNNVKIVLDDLIDLLDIGGRLAVITFHSLEDKIVKDHFKLEVKGCHCPPELPICVCGHVPRIKLVNKKPISPSEEEIAKNFRSRSAKLRVIEKI